MNSDTREDEAHVDTPIDRDHAAGPEQQPGIFITNNVIKCTTRPQPFKASVESLLQAGNVVATGQEGIERVFATASSFGDWFNTIRPYKSE